MLTVEQMLSLHAILTDTIAAHAQQGSPRGQPVGVMLVVAYCPSVGEIAHVEPGPYQHDVMATTTARTSHSIEAVKQQLSSAVLQLTVEGHA